MGAKQPRWPCLPRREAREGLSRPSRRFATTSGFVNPLPVSRRHLYALYFLNIRNFKTFWTVPGTFPSTSGSRILLPVQHPRPEMECQQVCFTSASDYIPPVPLGTIVSVVGCLSCPKWRLKLLPVPVLTANLDLSHPVSLQVIFLDVYLQG